MIVAHYKTGALYRVLFETGWGIALTIGRHVLSAINVTNGEETRFVAIHAARYPNGGIGMIALDVDVTHPGVVYVALADGKIYFRRKSEFYETVDVSHTLGQCIRPAHQHGLTIHPPHKKTTLCIEWTPTPPARVPRFKEVKL